MRVLIAEDDPLILTTFQRALERAGHEVCAVEDGAAALEAYIADPFPLVVTDWNMPKMTGVELCRRIRKRRAAPYAHVMIVTSLSPDEHMIEAFRAGADDFVGKPCQAAALVARVAAAERGLLATTENSLRDALETIQKAIGPEHAALLEALEAVTDVCRKQRSYVRCRAFLRRQRAIAEQAFGAEDSRTMRIRSQLDELASFEEEL